MLLGFLSSFLQFGCPPSSTHTHTHPKAGRGEGLQSGRLHVACEVQFKRLAPTLSLPPWPLHCVKRVCPLLSQLLPSWVLLSFSGLTRPPLLADQHPTNHTPFHRVLLQNGGGELRSTNCMRQVSYASRTESPHPYLIGSWAAA